MNIVSTMVGLSIMGAASPMMLDMSLAPIVAQKRAQNLGTAESAAVTFAAANEGTSQLTGDAPDGCELASFPNRAYEITCTEGDGTKYVQTVTRAFRLAAEDLSCDDDGNNGHGNSGGNDCSNPGNNTPSGRTFPYPINPYGTTGIECHDYENWGTSGAFKAWSVEQQAWTKASCTPLELRTQKAFDRSDVNEWKWDINGRERGNHKSY